MYLRLQKCFAARPTTVRTARPPKLRASVLRSHEGPYPDPDPKCGDPDPITRQNSNHETVCRPEKKPLWGPPDLPLATQSQSVI